MLVKLKISELPLPELANKNVRVDPDQIPAWRKALEGLEKDRVGDVLPALPAPRIPGADWPNTPPKAP